MQGIQALPTARLSCMYLSVPVDLNKAKMAKVISVNCSVDKAFEHKIGRFEVRILSGISKFTVPLARDKRKTTCFL